LNKKKYFFFFFYIKIIIIIFFFLIQLYLNYLFLIIFYIMSRPKGADGPLPRYQNTFAFRHNPKSQKTLKIAAIPATSLCCRRCIDIIEWKKKYR